MGMMDEEGEKDGRKEEAIVTPVEEGTIPQEVQTAEERSQPVMEHEVRYEPAGNGNKSGEERSNTGSFEDMYSNQFQQKSSELRATYQQQQQQQPQQSRQAQQPNHQQYQQPIMQQQQQQQPRQQQQHQQEAIHQYQQHPMQPLVQNGMSNQSEVEPPRQYRGLPNTQHRMQQAYNPMQYTRQGADHREYANQPEDYEGQGIPAYEIDQARYMERQDMLRPQNIQIQQQKRGQFQTSNQPQSAQLFHPPQHQSRPFQQQYIPPQVQKQQTPLQQAYNNTQDPFSKHASATGPAQMREELGAYPDVSAERRRSPAKNTRLPLTPVPEVDERPKIDGKKDEQAGKEDRMEVDEPVEPFDPTAPVSYLLGIIH
jgi:hypothetical protein